MTTRQNYQDLYCGPASVRSRPLERMQSRRPGEMSSGDLQIPARTSHPSKATHDLLPMPARSNLNLLLGLACGSVGRRLQRRLRWVLADGAFECLLDQAAPADERAAAAVQVGAELGSRTGVDARGRLSFDS